MRAGVGEARNSNRKSSNGARRQPLRASTGGGRFTRISAIPAIIGKVGEEGRRPENEGRGRAPLGLTTGLDKRGSQAGGSEGEHTRRFTGLAVSVLTMKAFIAASLFPAYRIICSRFKLSFGRLACARSSAPIGAFI
jgi:hypothetical protein